MTWGLLDNIFKKVFAPVLLSGHWGVATSLDQRQGVFGPFLGGYDALVFSVCIYLLLVQHFLQLHRLTPERGK
jgi:hypothetical protein